MPLFPGVVPHGVGVSPSHCGGSVTLEKPDGLTINPLVLFLDAQEGTLTQGHSIAAPCWRPVSQASGLGRGQPWGCGGEGAEVSCVAPAG